MKKIIFFVCLLVYPKLSFSQNLSDSNNTVLWGVVNVHGDTSYLFGTFHEFGNAYFDSYLSVQNACRRSSVVVTENIPVAHHAGLDYRHSWANKLSHKDYKLVKQYFQNLDMGVKFKFVKRIPPSWVEYMMLSKLIEQRCKTQTKQDVVRIDQYIVNSAITHQQQLSGLESPNDTFNVINRMMGTNDNNDTAGIAALIYLVKNEEKFIDNVDEQCREAENYKKLTMNYKFEQPSSVDNTDYLLMLDNRNKAWLPQIEKIADSSKAFIAVGFKHLLYKTGLIMELRKDGYIVFPIAMQKREFTYTKRG